MDFGREIRAIGDLIVSAAMIEEIRREVATVMKTGFVVTDGIHHPNGQGYDVVVRCGSEDRPDVFRRISGKMPEARVEKISDGVLGIRSARRMRRVVR